MSAKMGRPSKRTPAMVRAICDGIEAGLFAETVCAANGIDWSTHYRWMREDADYRQAVRESEMKLQLLLLDVIRTGETGSGQALSLLERRFQKQWSIRTKAAIGEREEDMLRALREGLTAAEYMKVINVLAGESEGGEEATRDADARAAGRSVEVRTQ